MDRRFSGPNVLKAISDLFGGGYGTDGARRQADALLRDFAKADCVVPVSFELLRLHLSQAQRLPEEALQLLATGLRFLEHLHQVKLVIHGLKVLDQDQTQQNSR